MRSFLPLVVLLLLPTAQAWSIELDAPGVAGATVPFEVRACVDAPAGTRVQWKATLLDEAGAVAGGLRGVSPGRYGAASSVDASGRTCTPLVLEPAGRSGNWTLEVKVRPEGGAAKATARATLAGVEVSVGLLRAEESVTLRFGDGELHLPSEAGVVLVPQLPNAHELLVGSLAVPLPTPVALRIAEVRAGALAGVLLDPAGYEGASMFHLRQGGRTWPVADGHAEGARWFVPAEGIRTGALELAAAGHVFDTFEVPKLRAGERADATGVSRIGTTKLDVARTAIEGTLLAYATPDAGAAPLTELIDAARERIVAELYTLTSPEVAHALAEASLRGVRVDVLLEGAPVGGVPTEERALVAGLLASGARVSWLASAGGFPARYQTLHAKMFVVDGRFVALSTDNPTPTSYPAVPDGRGTRGFGIIVENTTLARWFEDIHAQDAGAWPDVQPARVDRLAPVPELTRRAGSRAGEDAALTLSGAWNITPVISPDTSLSNVTLLGMMQRAERSLDVAMLFAEPAFGAAPNPYLDALLEAARRGVHVRLLLDGRHADAQQEAVVRGLMATAAREELALEVRLARPDHVLHAKLVLADGAESYVGSMNWGSASARSNREMGLIVENATLAQWYTQWFEKEWEEEEKPASRRGVPDAGIVGGLLVVGLTSRGLRGRSPRRA